MTTELTIRAHITRTQAGVTYECELTAPLVVENSGQVVTEFEKLMATAYRALDNALANMPGKNKTTGETFRRPTGQPAAGHGTEMIPVTAYKIGFNDDGSRYVSLIGGKYQKFGVMVYPERIEMLEQFVGTGTDWNVLAPGLHPISGIQMVISHTSEGKVTLNDIRPIE
jgi:hypothetical protein